MLGLHFVPRRQECSGYVFFGVRGLKPTVRLGPVG